MFTGPAWARGGGERGAASVLGPSHGGLVPRNLVKPQDKRGAQVKTIGNVALTTACPVTAQQWNYLAAITVVNKERLL